MTILEVMQKKLQKRVEAPETMPFPKGKWSSNKDWWCKISCVVSKLRGGFKHSVLASARTDVSTNGDKWFQTFLYIFYFHPYLGK